MLFYEGPLIVNPEIHKNILIKMKTAIAINIMNDSSDKKGNK